MGSSRDGVRRVEEQIGAKRRTDLRIHLSSGGTEETFAMEKSTTPARRVSPPSGVRAPKAIKTFEFLPGSTPGTAPKSPYRNADEEGRVMSRGMTGNRLPLMNEKRVTKRRGLSADQTDRYGNPLDPKTIQAEEMERNRVEMLADESLLAYMRGMDVE